MVSPAALAELRKHAADILEHAPLAPLNPLGTGGTAELLVRAPDAVTFVRAVRGAMLAGITYVVVGRASSSLFADGGYPGLVIVTGGAGAPFVADQRSRVAADAGLSLRSFIAAAASQGYGGLVSLYADKGTVGGAVARRDPAAMAAARSITLLVPPTRMRTEPAVVRVAPSPDGTIPRFSGLRSEFAVGSAYPVLISAQFQLTSVRPDELRRRLAALAPKPIPPGLFGPVLEAAPDAAAVLTGQKAETYRRGDVQPDRRNPLYLRAVGRLPTAGDVWSVCEALSERLKSAGVQNAIRIDRLGAW